MRTLRFIPRRRLVALLLMLCLVTAAATGCGSSKSAQQTVTVTVAVQPTTTSPLTTAPPPRSRAVQASLVTFRGTYSSIDYPSSFTVAPSEASKGSYVDTTITNPANASVLIRLDVLPTTDSTPDPNAARVRQALASQPGYRELQFVHTPFAGYNAIRWEFVVQEHGVLLHKVDTFFIDNSADEVAILTQAPESVYARWSPLFGRIQSSFSESGTPIASPQATAPPPAPASPPAAPSFCDTHTCIPNFDNGNGYIVQCADGEWSQSGGLSGACSYHGGEAGG